MMLIHWKMKSMNFTITKIIHIFKKEKDCLNIHSKMVYIIYGIYLKDLNFKLIMKFLNLHKIIKIEWIKASERDRTDYISYLLETLEIVNSDQRSASATILLYLSQGIKIKKYYKIIRNYIIELFDIYYILLLLFYFILFIFTNIYIYILLFNIIKIYL